MSYLNQENVFSVAGAVYDEVQKRYNLNVEGYYLDDIQNVMHKLWEKNKDKSRGKNPSSLFNALNRKTVEIVLPQVFRNIEAGYLNKTQNNMFDKMQQQQPEVKGHVQNSGGSDRRVQIDTSDAYERLRKEREQEGNLAPALQDQKNVYSSNSYQNKPVTYDNNLPMTQQVQDEVEPDAAAVRFVNGNPVYQNDRQGRVKDVGPTNAPGFFRPRDPFGGADATGPSLDSFFKDASNLRGIQNPNQADVIPGTNGENTSKEYENRDVEDKFSKLKVQYLQDGKLDRPKDASNLVEDVVGKKMKNTRQFTEHFDNKQPQKQEDIVKKVQMQNEMNSMMFDSTKTDTFFINDKDSKIVEENRKKANDELIINNQLSNNAYVNYALIPPEKLNYQTRKYYITVDSLQRDFEAYPYPTNFQVRFEQPGNTVEIPQYLNANGVVVYGPAVIYQSVGGNGAKLENIYENVVELKCLEAQIPLDAIYAGGLAPYVYNGPKIDENKLVPNQFPSYPYGPVFQENYGIYIDVLDEPYYFLVVDEIDGAYDGTNLASRRALAKLNYDKLYGVTKKFVGLKTAAQEGKSFYPTTLAKLSQMTLKLVTRFNQLLNVGVDKVFIKSIEQGELVTGDRYCPLPPGTHLTKITIIPEDPSYGQPICATGQSPGDKVLFYSIYQCNPLKFYTKLNEKIYINLDKYPIVYFYMVFQNPPSPPVEKKVDVRPFLNVSDLIILNNQYVLDIMDIDANGIFIKVQARTPFDPKTTITSKGFVNVRRAGNNDEDRLCFLAQNGQRVGGKLDEPLSFQVLYPFESVPDYLRSPPYGFYNPYEAFYIQGKKQISYTFEVTQVEQNQDKLDSRVIARG